MSAFKVGQRVKRVANATHPIPLGSTGTIRGFKSAYVLGAHADEVYIDWDDAALASRFFPPWSFDQLTLAPLTDPGAEKFIERIKNLKPLDEPRELRDLEFVDRVTQALANALRTRARISFDVLRGRK